MLKIMQTKLVGACDLVVNGVIIRDVPIWAEKMFGIIERQK